MTSFLRPPTPPRSPHVTVAGTSFPFTSRLAIPSSQQAGTEQSTNPYSPALRRAMLQSKLRPGKRDVVVCLVTLLFAWVTIGMKSPSVDRGTYGSSYNLASPNMDSAKASWYGSHYISKVGNKFSNFKSFWPGSAKELEQLEDVLCPTMPGGGYESMDEQGLLGLGSKADNDEEEDDDVGVLGGATRITGHSPGWTVFENLYLFNGTLFIVTNDPHQYPELRLMTSTGLPANNEPGNEEAREPTGNELQFISVKDAKELWGDRIWAMEGMTWLFNDGQFIDHYYHFAAELFLGIWRSYTTLGKRFTASGETDLPAPARAWFIRATELTWRDKPRFNAAILWSAFPSLAVLYQDDWKDIARATSSGKPKAYYFPKAILADRSAAFRGPHCASTSRTVAEALHVGQTNQWWWEPIRRQVLRFAGTPEDVISRNLWGHGAVNPATFDHDSELRSSLGDPELAPPADWKPLVTYISRQSSRRRLTPESHADLVNALEKHSKAKGWELQIVEAEHMTKEEQLNLAARTTIMLGVHGNGLTHLLWMPPTPQSAVIEMFFVGGFARDYQWTAQNLGIRHFAVRHDEYATAPNEPKVDYPEGFQGTSITVVGEVVAQLIDDRLDGKV
ncbi:hypothetical protein QFC20_000852 [Naganishia adeliensis]|uniref:Uncharacterized protein n=1 Tax=Naganishia adeliensis TaxID=92952 RepID=A0ACC2WYQ2_9TREE|nr:hypothetical protein QFC20_000852 [Naganishia adeliensis]